MSYTWSPRAFPSIRRGLSLGLVPSQAESFKGGEPLPFNSWARVESLGPIGLSLGSSPETLGLLKHPCWAVLVSELKLGHETDGSDRGSRKVW